MGDLSKDGCTSWISQEQCHDSMTHYPIRCPVYMQVVLAGLDGIEGIQLKPFVPVGVFKHYQQYNYNKSKFKLDKNTEITEASCQSSLCPPDYLRVCSKYLVCSL